MATNAGILPSEVTQQLSKLERTVRSLSLVRGLGLVLAVFCVSLGVGLLIDYLLDLGVLLRCLLLVGVAVATATVFWQAVARPAMFSLDQAELAAMVEAANPKLDERLTSTIELNDPNIPEQFRGSAVMRAHLKRQCRQSVSSINFSSAVSPRPMQKSLAAATLATCLVAAPLFLWPNAYQTLMQRFFQPWANIQRVTNLYFEVPGGSRVVAKGSDVEITAVPRWRRGGENELPTAVMFNQTGQDGRTESRRMRYREDDGAFFILVPHVLQPFDYDVTADSTRSEQFAIDVVAAPEIRTVGLNIEPPAYTGLPAKLIDGAAGQIEAFEHSQMAFDVEFSKPVVSAELVWLSSIEPIDAQGVDGNAARDSSVVTPESLPFLMNHDRTRGSLQMLAQHSGRFALRAVDEFELENEDQADRYLTVIRDQPPTLAVAGNDAPDEAHPQDVIPIRIAASDDIGLGELELHIEVGHNEQNKNVVRKMEGGPNGKRELSHEFSLNLSELEVDEGVLVAWRVRATDERPIPGPNETWSSRRFLTITSEAAAPGALQLAFEQKQMKDELERIIGLIQENRDEARSLKNELWKPGKNQNDPADNKQIEEFAAEQTKLADDLESLNDRLDQHPLFEKLVENSREVSRRILPEAGEHFEAARQETTNKGNRANELTQAERKLNEADWKLQSVLREFDKLAELERDLLELQRMANQAKQVADNADQVEKQRNELAALPDGQQKRQAQNELANQQRQLAGEQQQLSQELNDLLDRRPELIEAAKRAQLEKMQELAEQARQLVEPQQQLQQAFNEEGKDAAEDTRRLDPAEQELLAKARELARQAQQVGATDPQAAEQALKDAAAALDQGDLAKAQQLQDKAQQELDQLANVIRTPDDPREAVEQMAKQQRELAEELQQQADANKPADQKRDELQKLARQQEQLQQAISNTNLPQGNEAVQQQAAQQADAAKQKSQDGKPAEAAEQANQAADSLEQLADQLPSKEELQKQAAQQVAEIRKQQEANREQTQQKGATDQTQQKQQKLSEQLSDLVAPDAAREAGEAVERSASASDELAKNNAESAVQEQQRTEQELARIQEKLAGKPTSDERLQQLQKEQQQVAKAARDAFKDEENKDAGKQQAQQQQQIAAELSQLDTPAAQSQKQAATKAAQEAARQLASGNQQQSERAMQQAQEAMQELADALGERPQDSQPQQPASAQQREQLAEQATQLADEIAQLAKQLEQTRQERLAQKSLDPANQDTAPNAADDNANQQNAAGDAPPDPVEQALGQQRQIAQDAARLARDVADQNGQDSAAAKDAQTMAAEARSAAMHAQAGRFNAARDINKAGARTANETKQKLGTSQQPDDAPPGQSNEQLAQRASELGEQMQQASQKMAEMAQSPTQRNQAQVGQQDALQQATQEIAQAMQAAAERLYADPLNMQAQSESGQNASQAAQQASQSQQQAQHQAEQGNANSASQMAQQAAESLQQAAQQARQAGSEANKFQNSPVPNEVGTQVADAVEQLRRAAEQLAQQMDPKGDQQLAQSESDASQQQQPGEDGKPAQPSDSQQGQPGQDGQSQPGQDDQPGQDGKPGEQKGKSSKQQGKPGGKPGESMRNAAQSLADAAKNAQPSQAKGKGGKPQQGDQVSANMNEPDQLPEGVSAEDMRKLLPGLMKPEGRRNWGKLPGTLQTEILQAAKKNPNGEYARLIKLYFKEIAGSGQDDK